MRVVGEVSGTPYRIQIFYNNNRYIIKFETAHYEQAFKLREDPRLDTLEKVKEIAFSLLAGVQKQFTAMHENAIGAVRLLDSFLPKNEEDEFDTIV